MEKSNTFDNIDNFLKIMEPYSLNFIKKNLKFTPEYRYFYYDIATKKYDDRFKTAVYHYIKAIFYFLLDLNSKAYEELMRSEVIFREVNAYHYVFDTYMFSFLQSLLWKDYKKSKELIQTANNWLGKIENDTIRWDRTAVLNWNYGRMYVELNELEKAKFHLDSARRLVEKLRKMNSVYQVDWNYSIVYSTLSSYYQKKGQLDSALLMLEVASKLERDKYYVGSYTTNRLNRQFVQIYLQKKDYKNIINTVETFFNDINDSRMWDNDYIITCKIELYNQYAEAYYQLGNKDKAYEIMKELNKLHQITADKYKSMDVISAKLDLESKLQQEEYQKKITYILFGSIIFAIIVSVLIYYNRYRQIRKLNRKLNDMNETKNRLFSIISHDLRGPILSNYQLIENIVQSYNKIDDKTKFNYLSNIQFGMQKVANLLENLLQWSQFQMKNSKIHFEEIQIRDAIQNVVDQIGFIADKKNIKINLDCISCDKIIMNKNEFEVLIRNLLTNAIKFSSEDGNINIRGNNDNGQVFLQISDNGIGNADDLMNSFNQFNIKQKSGTKGEKGSGLGLVIVNDILKRNNGQIAFQQNSPTGIIVNLTLENRN